LENRRVLVDTSVIIDYLRKTNKEKTLFWELVNKYNCYVSAVTVYEIYTGAKDEAKRVEADTVISFLNVIPFDTPQAKNASIIFQKLKKKNKLIEFRDIFIASCAIVQNIQLATFNTNHFERIKELKILK